MVGHDDVVIEQEDLFGSPLKKVPRNGVP